MNTTELIEMTKQTYSAFGRGDIPSILQGLDENVVWTVPGPPEIVAASGVFRGVQGVASFFSRIGETMKFDVFDPQDYVGEGDTVVALGRAAGTIVQTGKPFDFNWAMVFTYANGKLTVFREYFDTAHLIEASTN